MYHFTVEDFQAVDQCIKCCCERLNLKPGTTTKVSVGYAPWAVPIGRLHCDPQFNIEQMETCSVQPTGNLPPQLTATTDAFAVTKNIQLADDLTTRIVDPEAVPLTFKLLPLYGPQHGQLKIDSVGTFTYTPAQNYSGPDRCFVSASDGVNTSMFEIRFAVGVPVGSVMPTPTISVGKPTVDDRYYQVSFPVTVSPAAQQCEIWKLTVLQAALDCDCTCYTRTDCFDIGITKC